MIIWDMADEMLRLLSESHKYELTLLISSISSLSVLSVLWGPLVLYFNSAAVSFCFWVIKSSVQSATAVGCICIDMCSNICVALSWLTSVAVALLRLFESRGRFNLNKISSLRATV